MTVLDMDRMNSANTLILKKYASRRLYNPESSTYVTLNQIADIIRDGKDVQVLDAKTKEDVTAFILTQIVLEEAKNRNALLPAPLLHIIIRFGGRDLQEFFQKHILQVIDTYLQFKKTFDDQFRKWIGVEMNYSEMAQKTLSELSAFHALYSGSEKKRKETADKKKKGG
jgi:polyhydroxyalkanoate synthesis repressor PhaR